MLCDYARSVGARSAFDETSSDSSSREAQQVSKKKHIEGGQREINRAGGRSRRIRGNISSDDTLDVEGFYMISCECSN